MHTTGVQKAECCKVKNIKGAFDSMGWLKLIKPMNIHLVIKLILFSFYKGLYMPPHVIV